MLICRAYFKNKDWHYLDAVHRGLSFWIQNDFQCSNWWQNQINVPFAYSSLMLMLDKNATIEELGFLNKTLNKRTWVYKATVKILFGSRIIGRELRWLTIMISN